jgi:hypothetical protein
MCRLGRGVTREPAATGLFGRGAPVDGQKRGGFAAALPANEQRRGGATEAGGESSASLPDNGALSRPKAATLGGLEEARVTISRHKVKAVARYKDVGPGVRLYALNVFEKMTGNPWFTGPVPYLAELGVAVDDLRVLEAEAAGGGKAERAVRDDKKGEVKDLLQLLCAYVEFVANKQRELAAMIIQSTGFDLKRSTRPGAKAPIRIRQRGVSGEVIIDVKSPGKDAIIYYQASGDGGLTWVDLGSPQNTRLTKGGFTPGKKYLFRYAYTLRKGGKSDPSQHVEFMVK